MSFCIMLYNQSVIRSFGQIKYFIYSILAAVKEHDVVETFHPYDGKEVICEEKNDHGGHQARIKDDCGAKHISESPLHAKERQQPRT